MKHLDLLTQALTAEIGIEIFTSNASTLRGVLYKTLKEAKELGMKEYDCLKLQLSPTKPSTHLWILKRKKVENDSEEKQQGIDEGEH